MFYFYQRDMKTAEITAKQYAQYIGCSEQNITKKVRNFLNGKSLKLDEVYGIKRYSRFYTLEVPEWLAKEIESWE